MLDRLDERAFDRFHDRFIFDIEPICKKIWAALKNEAGWFKMERCEYVRNLNRSSRRIA